MAGLWSPDGVYVTGNHEHRGTAAIEAAVTTACRDFLSKGFVFLRGSGVAAHHRGVTFTWHMRPRDSEQVVAVGREFLLLDKDGRIGHDHQFMELLPGS